MGILDCGSAGEGSALLDGLQIRNNGTHIVGVKLEFRHVGVAGHEALAQGLFQGCDRIALAEGAKRRGVFGWTVAAADRMAGPASLREQRFAALERCV